MPRRLVASLFCFSSCIPHGPHMAYLSSLDATTLVKKSVFFLCATTPITREREREKKKRGFVLTRRERPKLSTSQIGLVFYEELCSCVILSPCFCDVTKRPPRPVFSSSCCQRERVCVCVCVCVCVRAREREKKRARVRNDPSRKKKKKKEYGKRIGYPLRKRREILYRF